MTIQFNEIPSNFRAPFFFVEFDNTGAIQGLQGQPYKLLVIGQRLSTGTKPALEFLKVTDKDTAALYFGAGSMLAGMAEAVFSNSNHSVLNIEFCALDDAVSGNVAATGTVTFGGTATEAGAIQLYISGRRVIVGVAVGDDGDAIAIKCASAIALETSLPVTAVVNGITTEQVDISAQNDGEVGDDIDIRDNYLVGDETPAGVTVVIVQMSGGTTNPDVQDIIDLMGDNQFNVIANPYTDTANIVAMETELADRFGPLRQLDGNSISAHKGDFSTVTAYTALRNSPHSTIIGSFGSPTPTYEWAAETAAIATKQGQDDPARPMQTLPYRHCLAPSDNDQFTLTERNLLLFDGVATTKTVVGVSQIDRLITTYQVSPAGGQDPSYLDLNTLFTLSFIRFDIRNFFVVKYPRAKLADDGTRFGAGQVVMTPKTFKAETIGRFALWEEKGLVEGAAQFEETMIVERDGTDPNRINAVIQPDLINQFRVAGVQVRFLL